MPFNINANCNIRKLLICLIPLLPQIVGQAQQPQAAYGYGYANTGFGGQSGYGG